MAAEDKQMDKSFKRDFAVTEEFFDVLYALFKRRKNPPRAAMEPEGGDARDGRRQPRASVQNMARRVSRASKVMPSIGKLMGSAKRGGAAPRSSISSFNSDVSETNEDDALAAALVLVTKHDPFAAAWGGPVSEESLRPKAPAVEALDPGFDRPEGLDMSWWDRLVEHRERKVGSCYFNPC